MEGQVTKRTVPAEAAASLRSILRLVDAGEVFAESSKARAVLRQLEGAVMALQLVAQNQGSADDAVAAGELLRLLLDAVWDGDLVADSPRALALLHRLEGAVTALEASAYGRIQKTTD